MKFTIENVTIKPNLSLNSSYLKEHKSNLFLAKNENILQIESPPIRSFGIGEIGKVGRIVSPQHPSKRLRVVFRR
jgi:hypothetical protein